MSAVLYIISSVVYSQKEAHLRSVDCGEWRSV